MDHDHLKQRTPRASFESTPSEPPGERADRSEREGHAEFQEATRLTRRRRYVKLAFWLLVPALVVWIAPAIVAHTPLRQSLLKTATAKLNGDVTVGSASFGWLSPIRLYDVAIFDAEGESLLQAESIATERTLLGLILHSRDPGAIRVDRPAARLALRGNGSNWEDAVAPLLEGPSSGQPIRLAVEVLEGTVELVDAETERSWKIEHLQSKIELPGGDGPIEAQLRGDVAAEGGSSGALDAALRWEAGRGPGKGQVTLKTEAFPLDILGPVLRRFAGPMGAVGVVSFAGQYEWSAGEERGGARESGLRTRKASSPENSDKGESGGEPTNAVAHHLAIDKLVARDVVVQAAAWIGRDELRVPELTAHGKVDLAADRVELRDINIQSGIASLEAEGGLSLATLRDGATSQRLLALLQSEDFTLRGELDLAQLAQLFPETLRVREGIEITSGKLVASLDSRVDRQRRTWQGRIESSNLTALNAGRRVTWEQPILVTLQASQGKTGPVIEKLECKSSFLQAAAQGTPSEGRVALEGDLSRLAEELSQFVDLGQTRLAGKLRADLNWILGEGDRATGHGEIGLSQFELVLGHARPWREEALHCVVDVQATVDEGSIDTVHAAALKVTAGEDNLDVELTDAVRAPSTDSTWPLKGRLRGDLARWLPRVQSFLPLTGWDLAGDADLQLTARLGTQRMDVESAKLDFRDLAVVGAGLFVNEPQVQVELAGTWDRTRNGWQVPSLTFASSSLAFRADQVAWEPADRGGNLSANVGLRSDLARLSAWLQDPRNPIDWQLAGMASGQVRLAHSAGSTSARWGLEFDNVVYARAVAAPQAGTAQLIPATTAPALETAWSEPKLKWSGEGTFDSAKNLFRIAQSQVDGDGLQVKVAGTVSEATERCLLALEGEMAYDLPRLVTRLRSHLGPSLQLQGRDVRPFALRGPIRHLELATSNTRLTAGSTGAPAEAATWPPKDFAAQAGLNWTSASVFGLPIGPGELDAQLKDRVLQFKPVDIDVAEGRVHLAPRIHWDQPEPVVVAEAGPALENVRLSPELCATWLKYVLPILADVTEAEGRFSIELSDTAVVPLNRPEDGEIRGKMDVHGVQVGPSPLTRELIGLAQTIKAIADNKTATDPPNAKMWLQLPEQSIPFHWKQRRVYHDRLEVNLKDVAIVTGGSVGIDQTLNMVAEIPIRDEWVSRNRYLASLQGQRLQIPITGSLSKPHVDRRALQNLATQAVTNSANSFIEKELTRGVDRFLRPRQPTAPQQPPQPQPPQQPPQP